MEIKNRLMDDLKAAMKEHDRIKNNTIQLVRAAILQYEKDKQQEADDNKVLDIIASELKKRKDAFEQFVAAGRDDLMTQCEREMRILEMYLPEQLSDEELTSEVEEVFKVSEHNMKDMMKNAKDRIGNKADGKRIAKAVKDRLERGE